MLCALNAGTAFPACRKIDLGFYRQPEPFMDPHGNKRFHPDALLLNHIRLFTHAPLGGPVLDLACGDGHNGIFLASKGLSVTLCDVSAEALERAEAMARTAAVNVRFQQVDLEKDGSNPLQEDFFGGILVFRYLHRPLIPHIKKALKMHGILVYETFTIDQPQFGRPHNPRFLLKHGELSGWFGEWPLWHYFEGIMENPRRAVAQMVCRKPGEQRNDGILE
jgi:SAM-dependent methyltransferase